MSASKPVFQHSLFCPVSGNHACIGDNNRLKVDVASGDSCVQTVPFPMGVPPHRLLRMPVMNSGSKNLCVDGSSTPVVFTVDCDSSKDLYIHELRFIFSAQDIAMRGDAFGARDELTNGILIEVTCNGVNTVLANLQLNECIAAFCSPGGAFVFNNSGAYHLIASGLLLHGQAVLKAGTSDNVKVTIRDDLTHVTYKHACLVVFGAKEE